MVKVCRETGTGIGQCRTAWWGELGDLVGLRPTCKRSEVLVLSAMAVVSSSEAQERTLVPYNPSISLLPHHHRAWEMS